MDPFLNRLEQASAATQSLVCIGLDVDPARMPTPDILKFTQAIVDATSDQVCAYKPNLAYYESLGMPGLRALESTVAYIRKVAPQVCIIGDGKRGDIGSSGQAYAHAMFRVWDFDAATANAWGGFDTIEPFLEYEEKGVFIWCRGSNPGSGDLQDLLTISPQGQVPVYQVLAKAAQGWNEKGNVGLVVGATYPEQIEEVRRIGVGMPLLIPGIGTQGGDLAASVLRGTDSRGRLAIINSSRTIIYASNGPDFAQAARQEAKKLRNAINRILESAGTGWS
jgi:orotidine-5'-phosphate decarboxylase